MAQGLEHLTFNLGVVNSNPRVTVKSTLKLKEIKILVTNIEGLFDSCSLCLSRYGLNKPLVLTSGHFLKVRVIEYTAIQKAIVQI